MQKLHISDYIFKYNFDYNCFPFDSKFIFIKYIAFKATLEYKLMNV